MAFPKRKPPKKKPRRRKSLWTRSAGLTNSGIKLWSNCREQFALKYMDGWTSKGISIPLTYGSVWHAAQEYQDARNPWFAVDKFLELGSTKLNSYAYRDLEIIVATVKAVFPIYAEHYAKQDAKISWLARESSFKIPYSIPVGNSVYELPLAGKRDGDFRTEKGTLALFETKTKSSIDQRQISNLLRSDLQTILYCWALWKEHKEAPGAILYNVVKRPQLRQGKDESLKSFITRIENDAHKNRSKYFLRWSVTLNEADLKQFEKQHLFQVCQAFMHWWLEVRRNPFLPERLDGRHPSHFINLGALTTPFGKAELYDLMVLGSKGNYYQRSCPHPELEP